MMVNMKCSNMEIVEKLIDMAEKFAIAVPNDIYLSGEDINEIEDKVMNKFAVAHALLYSILKGIEVKNETIELAMKGIEDVSIWLRKKLKIN